MNASTSPPLADTLEVSLFGTGNGESIAVHLGMGQWMLVDSCTCNSDPTPLSLAYLKSLGVDYANDVKLIVATHWHDDHIRGMSTLVDLCPRAELAFSQALACDEFRSVFGLYLDEHHSFDREKSGVKEMGECLKILLSRSDKPDYRAPLRTQADLLVFRNSSTNCDVWALSPSPLAIENSYKEIAGIWNALVEESQGGKGPRPPRASITSPERNHNAIALWVTCGDDRKILLGADLEECNHASLGWQAVLKCKIFPCGQAGVFKIPHHGSPNGDHEPVWSQIISTNNPFTCVTAYNKGKTPRPSSDDIARILKHTKQLHHTDLPSKIAANRYDRTVERTIAGTTKQRKSLKSNPGHVQMRWDASGHISVLYGGAAGLV